MEGLSINDWKITPLIRPVVSSCWHHIHSAYIATNFPHWLQPQVTKKQVDDFGEGKLTPCCQLVAEVSGKITTLNYQVKIEGAEYPNDVFVINLPAILGIKIIL
jgi:hypothetical protein